jgi:hypothetical protein
VIVGGGAFASAASSGERQDQTFTVIGKQIEQHLVNLGPKSFSVGDEFLFTNQLLNTAQTKNVGTLNVVCTVASTANGGTVHCVGTASLSGGTLEFAGLGSNGPTTIVSITGGTGRYIGAEARSRAAASTERSSATPSTSSANTRSRVGTSQCVRSTSGGGGLDWGSTSPCVIVR